MKRGSGRVITTEAPGNAHFFADGEMDTLRRETRPPENLIPNTPVSGLFCQSGDPVSGSSGNRANTARKYRFNQLFSENIRFKRFQTGLFSGP
jgi:hypothetical protein